MSVVRSLIVMVISRHSCGSALPPMVGTYKGIMDREALEVFLCLLCLLYKAVRCLWAGSEGEGLVYTKGCLVGLKGWNDA